MADAPLRLAIIVGSTREGRFGHVVAGWFAREARGHGGMELDLIDLVDVDLPATYPLRASESVQGFMHRLDRADAFVVVTPEYNHGYPASLKQAIDLVGAEWHAKPVGFVSYGGTAGGLRAVEQLRQVFAELHAVTVRDSVSFHAAHRRFDPAGEPRDPDPCNAAAKTMLDQLTWWAHALRAARVASPYAA